MEEKVMKTMLNWDHSLLGTTEEDMLHSIHCEACRFTGWPKANVDYDKGVLSVRLADNSNRLRYAVVYDVANRREITGRLSHIGMSMYVDEIHQVLGK